jgi:tRNA pseudouridine13 synthase
VGLDGEVLRLKDIGKPTDPFDIPRDRTKGKQKEDSEAKPESAPAAEAAPQATEETESKAGIQAEVESNEDLPETLRFEPLPLWTASSTRSLRPVFADECIVALHALLVEGKEPPPKTDSGWGSRKARVEVAAGNEEAALNVNEEEAANEVSVGGRGGRGQGRDRGRGRGGRGGRGGGRGGDGGWMANQDTREVLSQVCPFKAGLRCSTDS